MLRGSCSRDETGAVRFVTHSNDAGHGLLNVVPDGGLSIINFGDYITYCCNFAYKNLKTLIHGML